MQYRFSDFSTIARPLFSRTEDKHPKIRIWERRECVIHPAKRSVWLMPYCLESGSRAPAVILCPGGAYQFVSCHNEGYPVAEALNGQGIHAFVLHYRVGRHAAYPAPMEDLARAIQWIRLHQEELHVNGNQISIWGASAAGHLCSYFGARWQMFQATYNGMQISTRPESVVLSYPVINLVTETHERTRTNLLGKRASIEEQMDKSSDLLVTSDYPPVYLWHCEDDNCVPVSNSIRFDEALRKHGVPHTYHQFPTGGHGLGLAIGTSADPWFSAAVQTVLSAPNSDLPDVSLPPSGKRV